MRFTDSPSEILSYLFLGSRNDALRFKRLQELQITHILSVMNSASYADQALFRFLHVPLSDFGDTPLIEVWEQCFSFIDEAKKNDGKVLVHCSLGSSRAPAVVIAYLMSREGLTFKDSHTLVTSKRSVVAVHEDYIVQLEDLEMKLFNKSSLTQRDIGESVQAFIRRLRKEGGS